MWGDSLGDRLRVLESWLVELGLGGEEERIKTERDNRRLINHRWSRLRISGVWLRCLLHLLLLIFVG